MYNVNAMLKKKVGNSELAWTVIVIMVTCVSANPLASNQTDLMEERKLLFDKSKELTKLLKFKIDDCDNSDKIGSHECQKHICPEETKGTCEQAPAPKIGKRSSKMRCICTPDSSAANSGTSVKSAWTTWLQNNRNDLNKYSEMDECNRKYNKIKDGGMYYCTSRCPGDWTGVCVDSRAFWKTSLCYCYPKSQEDVESARLPLTTAHLLFNKAADTDPEVEAARVRAYTEEAKIRMVIAGVEPRIFVGGAFHYEN